MEGKGGRWGPPPLITEVILSLPQLTFALVPEAPQPLSAGLQVGLTYLAGKAG